MGMVQMDGLKTHGRKNTRFTDCVNCHTYPFTVNVPFALWGHFRCTGAGFGEIFLGDFTFHAQHAPLQARRRMRGLIGDQ